MMKKLLFATAMVAGFGMALSANAGEIGGAAGAVGSVGGAVGGIGGAVAGGVSGAVGKTGGAAGDIAGSVTGSAAAAINGTASGGNIGNAGNVVSNVAHFGAKANTTTRANTSTLAAADEIRQLSTLDSVSSVALVDASTSANIDANAASGAGNAAQVQAALANNANVMTAIMAEDPDFDMSKVVAADVLTIPFSIWLLRSFIDEVPVEIEEAARVDGASTAVILWRIVLPLILPGLIVTSMFAFVFSWNNAAFPLVLSNRATATLPVGTLSYFGTAGVTWGFIAAAAVAAMIPPMLIFLALDRYVVRGLTFGSVKG